MRERLRGPFYPSCVVAGLLVVLPACAGTNVPKAREVRVKAQASGNRAEEYFPLGAGFHWTYEIKGGPQRNWEVRLISKDPSESETALFSMKGYLGGAEGIHYVKATGESSIVEVGSQGSESLWYRFGARVGDTWTMHLVPPGAGGCEDGTTLVLASDNEVVTVPAGQFHNVIRIDRQQTLCADAGIVTEWFAPQVGLIRRVEESIAGPVTSELVTVKLGSSRWPPLGSVN